MARVYYNGKEYDEPNAAWSQDAPAMYRNTPEGVEQMWSAGYGGKGYKDALENWDNLSTLEQDILMNVESKMGAKAAQSSSDYSGGYGSFGAGTGGYTNPYADQLKAVSGKILNRDPFSYDYTTDPLYQQYQKEYTRLGQRAMDDTLAKISARTGGLASSYAASAGNQAYGNYMQQLSDKIPELEQYAYGKYNDEGNWLLNQLNMLRGLDSDAYNRFANERAYGDSRADLAYERDLAAQNQAFNRNLAGAQLLAQYGDMSGLEGVYGINGLQGLYDDANAVYAFGDDGTPYKISSQTGLNYLNSLMPGQSVAGGDGSVWSKDELGNITITRDGKTWNISSGKTGGRGGGSGKVVDTTPFSDATWKQIAQTAATDQNTAAALLQQYWDKLSDSQKNILARSAGMDPQDLAAMGGVGAYGKNDFATWASFLPSPAASGDIYQQMYNAGITTEAEAKRWLQQNGYDKYTEANDAAKTYASLFGSGSFGNATPSNLVTNITSEVKDHKSAVNYLQNNGVTAVPLTQEQWAMSSDKSKFATYKDYLQSFTYEYMNG